MRSPRATRAEERELRGIEGFEMDGSKSLKSNCTKKQCSLPLLEIIPFVGRLGKTLQQSSFDPE